jgi:hypothetical protein
MVESGVRHDKPTKPFTTVTVYKKKSQIMLFHINKDHNPFIVINY